MLVVTGRSFWIYSLLCTSIQLWGRVSASTSLPTFPAPKIEVYSQSRDSVVLVCKASEGHSGVTYMLYQFQNMVDTVKLESAAEEALFTVRVPEGTETELFCCLYKNQQGLYSAFSPYLSVAQLKDAAPTRSIPTFPPPILSMEPSGGVVKYGDMLSFSCSVPAPPTQSKSQLQSTPNYKPASFFLLRTAEGTELMSVSLQPQAIQESNPELQRGVFTLGPMRGDEEGQYACIYQIPIQQRLVNSTISNMVHVTFKDVLPAPSLTLQQQTQVWHLLCTGSPGYPGAMFSLYLVGNELPVATHRASVISHEATFLVPIQDTPIALYQCQYSVLLGARWSNSPRSLSLAVSRGMLPPSTPDMSSMDWPLILGSFSAVVLFLCSVALVVVVVHRKVKAAAERKKKRQEAKFWTQVHAKDHVVDLRLSCTSFTSQEWASGGTMTETASRSPLWHSHSTFTAPIH